MSFHKHAHKNVALVPRVLRVVPIGVQPIRWLDERWRGEPFVPNELLPLVTVI